jgi:hypothetical protein
MKNKIGLLVLCSAMMHLGSAEAAYVNVNNATANGAMATALNLDANFDKTFDANIGNFANGNISNSFFHASANAVTTAPARGGVNTLDWYSFSTYQANMQAFFDIDLTTSLNSFIKVYDSLGNVIFSNNDHAAGDPGSIGPRSTDSYISALLEDKGLYYLSVGKSSRPSGSTTNIQAALTANQKYTLHVSLENHVLPTPIPAAVWLFGSGFAGLVGFNRKKKLVSAIAV